VSQLALFRATDPPTSRDAAAMQRPKGCELDILRAIARHDSRFGDLTALEIWAHDMPWREYSTCKSAFSRLVGRKLLVVTGARKPDGKRAAQSTYAITDAGREQLA
jgi:hypothetical protein